MISYIIFYCTLQLLLLNFNEGIAVGRGPVFNGPGRSLVSATLSDRQTYITANTCYMKYYVSCKRQRVMHDDKYHHCNAVQKPCIIYCYLGWKMETPQIDHILLLHINLDGIHEQGEKWKPPNWLTQCLKSLLHFATCMAFIKLQIHNDADVLINHRAQQPCSASVKVIYPALSKLLNIYWADIYWANRWIFIKRYWLGKLLKPNWIYRRCPSQCHCRSIHCMIQWILLHTYKYTVWCQTMSQWSSWSSSQSSCSEYNRCRSARG